jgi:N-acetylneuraminate synthase
MKKTTIMEKNKIKVIAEIGINHNGDINIAKKLIDVALVAGCDFVKFQKRNPDICVPEHQKSIIKSTPWGDMTYLDYKYKVELGKKEYDEIDDYCKKKNIRWLASVWDMDSVDFMLQYGSTMKIPSALITDDQLIVYARKKSDFLMISTGMSNEQQIEKAIKLCDPDLIFHTNSTYPSPINELNLNYIRYLKYKYPNKIIGYSGHEFGLVTTFPVVVLGAEYIERHITLDRSMWGSDQMASVEPGGLIKLVKGVRDIEASLGEEGPRKILSSELSKLKSLRGD